MLNTHFLPTILLFNSLKVGEQNLSSKEFMLSGSPYQGQKLHEQQRLHTSGSPVIMEIESCIDHTKQNFLPHKILIWLIIATSAMDQGLWCF